MASAFLENLFSTCGCENALGFENSTGVMLKAADIQPWPARAMIQERLDKQTRLAGTSPLRTIPVRDGFEHFSRHIGTFGGLSKDKFFEISKNLIEVHKIKHKPDEIQSLQTVFDLIDYDQSNDLTIGEWASGLTIFFKGTQEEKSTALFLLIDRDGNGCISKKEMVEYVSPLVKAMTPPEAAALRPMLVSHAADTIFNQVDLDHDGKCSSSEFVKWRQNHDIVNELCQVIEGEVYKVWIEQQR